MQLMSEWPLPQYWWPHVLLSVVKLSEYSTGVSVIQLDLDLLVSLMPGKCSRGRSRSYATISGRCPLCVLKLPYQPGPSCVGNVCSKSSLLLITHTITSTSTSSVTLSSLSMEDLMVKPYTVREERGEPRSTTALITVTSVPQHTSGH